MQSGLAALRDFKQVLSHARSSAFTSTFMDTCTVLEHALTVVIILTNIYSSCCKRQHSIQFHYADDEQDFDSLRTTIDVPQLTVQLRKF